MNPELKDSELKINRIYWAEIIDKDLEGYLGKQIKVKFTGIAFRNIEYLNFAKPIGDFINDEKEAARKKLYDRKTELKKDAVLFRNQIKIFREANKGD